MKLIVRFHITLAYVLLMVFSLVALPRALWHNSEHHTFNIQHKNSKQTQLTIKQELCPICATHIAHFIAPIHWEQQLEILVTYLHTPSLNATEELSISSTLRLRGPPLA